MKRSNQETVSKAEPKADAVTPQNAAPAGKSPGKFVPRPLTLEEQKSLNDLELVVRTGLGGFIAVGKALKAIEDQKYYQAKYSTFEDYCKNQWNMSVSYAYRHKNAAECLAELEEDLRPQGVSIFPTNEAQFRVLLEPKKRTRQQLATIWLKVVKKTGGQAITAEKIMSIIRRKSPKATSHVKNKTGTPSAKDPSNKCLKAVKKLVKAARSKSEGLTTDYYKQLLDKIWAKLEKL